MKKYIEELIFKYITRIKWCYQFAHLFFPRLMRFKIGSLYEFCCNRSCRMKVINEDTTRRYKVAASQKEEYENYSYDKEIQREVTKQYIAELEEVIISGQTEGVFVAGMFLSDRVIYDEKGFHKFVPHNMRIHGDKCTVWDMQVSDTIIQNGIFLIKMWSSNYFHFVFESICRLGEIDKDEQYKDFPLLIDDVVKRDSRNIELIDRINVHRRKIIWISEHDYVKVKKLVAPPLTTWGYWDVKKVLERLWGYVIDAKAANYLRENILRGFVTKKKYNCVYVARGNNRRLLNEDEVIKYFSTHGFEIFYPDKSTFSEELECFATANCIVLCAGGASTNLLFCKKEVEIFCILPFEYRFDSPIDITASIGIIPHMRDAKIKVKGNILATSTFVFPIDKCIDIYEMCKNRGYI